jgi:putative transcriptional regulator
VNFLPGHLLIASEKLRDPNFFQSVVLLVRHNEEGAFGLALNRATGTALRDVWNQISTGPCGSPESLRIGGPIQGPLMALHRSPELVDIEATGGVFFTADKEKLEQLVLESPGSAKFFIGYAGWGPGQLETELEAGAWSTIAATPERVFREVDGFWDAMIKEMRGSSLLSALGIKHVPADPRMN